MTHVHEYRGERFTVLYDGNRCIHAGECVRGLPAVFDPERRPWIAPGAADIERVAEVVRRCPSGALTYRRDDGGPAESPPDARIGVVANGPLHVQGRVTIAQPDGTVLAEATRVALCRCGASGNKPFCDGSHEDVGFTAS